MKIIFKLWLFIFAYFSILSIPGYGSEFSKIDPKLKIMIKHPQMKQIYGQKISSLSKTTTAERINIILKTTADATILENAGVELRARIGDIVTASVPIAAIPKLAELDKVTYIQAPGILKAHTDISIPEIGALNVYQNYGTKGQGVIIGIIDTGIDWQHADFRKADGTTRIKSLLDFSDPGDTNGDGSLDGPDAYGGTLYTETDINNALSGMGLVPQDDIVGHGTHVAGCAAGNGLATGNGYPALSYIGVAPEADLVIIKATRNQGSKNFVSDDYIAALAFINDVAASEGKSFVANMSLGGNDGAHDGTSLGEQAIDNLVGNGIGGKAVVVSAGNDGEDALHSSGTFSESLTQAEIKFKVDSYQNEPGTYNDYVLFEIWYDGFASQTIHLQAPDGTTYGPISRRNDWSDNTTNGAILIDNAKSGANPFNSDNQIIVQIFDFSESNPPKAGDWTITLSGNSGRYDLWLSGASMDAYLTTNIDETMIVANPGTAKNAITVGSYVTKNSWIDLDGKSVAPVPRPDLSSASAFSSPGPSRDFRTKPEICAPGEWITSSLSNFALPQGEYSMFDTENDNLPNGFIMRDGKHAVAQGTSFSAPHVSGMIALMLQKFPQLDAFEIKDAIINSAKVDAYTTSPSKWGYGKLDGYAAMQDLAGESTEKKFTVAIFQNPAITQYIDIYLIAKYPLASTPQATMQIEGSVQSSIIMSMLDSQTYKGEYKFTSGGTASLTINATIQGESSTTLTKFFGVSLLKANTGGSVHFGNVTLFVPGGMIDQDAYFTIYPVDIEAEKDNFEILGQSYQIGPTAYPMSGQTIVEFGYNEALEGSKLVICRLEGENWNQLKSSVDSERNIVSAKASELGTYSLFKENSDLTTTKPESFVLYQNYPNPFNANTIISYELPVDAHVRVQIFNITGRRIASIFQGFQVAGTHRIEWDGKDDYGQAISSGIYFYRLTSENYTLNRKMIFLK